MAESGPRTRPFRGRPRQVRVKSVDKGPRTEWKSPEKRPTKIYIERYVLPWGCGGESDTALVLVSTGKKSTMQAFTFLLTLLPSPQMAMILLFEQRV